MSPSVNQRLKQVQKHIQPTAVPSTNDDQWLVVLPCGEKLSRSTQGGTVTFSIDDSALISYRVLPDTFIPLEITSVGTPFKGKTDHLPQYPVLEVVTQSTGPGSWWAGIYALVTAFHEQEHIPIVIASSTQATSFRNYLLRSGICRAASSSLVDANVIFITREGFWQGAGSHGWHTKGWLRTIGDFVPGTFPNVNSFTRSSVVIASHPLRPPNPPGGQLLYRRWCHEIGQTFELQSFDLEGTRTGKVVDEGGNSISKHLEAFHRWHNSEHVNAAWGEGGTMEQHISYLRRILADPAQVVCMMLWDGELMGYAELPWVKENHVSNHFPSAGIAGGTGDYDRGLHVLVGEDKFRGSLRAATWMRNICHYLFLEDPRTERIIGEPKADNKAIAKTLVSSGFHQQSTFDFSYKRSALFINAKTRFFKSDLLR